MSEQRSSVAATDRIVFGLHLQPLTQEQVVEKCREALSAHRRMLIGVVNAAKIVNLRRDELLRNSLLECDLIVADGQSVVWASRLLRQPLPERVAGCDLFESLLGVAEQDGRSVFLFGATAEVLQLLQSRLADRFPDLRIAGSRNGYFAEDAQAEIASQIRNSNADMLFLGITSPKKEIFLGTYGDSLGVPILHGVGGSFDVLAGVTKRAPSHWQRWGLEWAFRTLQEPRRMWKRYLTTNTRFLILLAREVVHPTPAYPVNRQGSQLVTKTAISVSRPFPRAFGRSGIPTQRGPRITNAVSFGAISTDQQGLHLTASGSIPPA